MTYSPRVQKFLDVYNSVNTNTVHLVREIYADKLEFRDPVHAVHGLRAFEFYLQGMYERTVSCKFHYDQVVENADSVAAIWTMELVHKKLNSGKLIRLQGSSFLKFDEHDKIVSHRDFFDLGELLYEQLPVVGQVFKFVKMKMGGG